MAHILSKFSTLNDVQLTGMIRHAAALYPYLESTSSEALLGLAVTMIQTHFMLEKKATPIRASYEFLRAITQTHSQEQVAAMPMFSERDFVFAIKMFGLKIREKNGLKQFVPENELDIADDEEVLLDNRDMAKELEFYVSDVRKRTKIQTNAIESAANRLKRDWREVELAKIFGRMMSVEGKSIGQARDYLRAQCHVKDHEFVRIREHALTLGVFRSKRNPSKSSRRVTLDEDVLPFVEELISLPSQNKRGQTTASQAVNQALRDLRALTRSGNGRQSAG